MTPSDLKKCRLALGLSQEQMALRMGFSVDALRSMEQGRRVITRRAELLAKAVVA